MELFNLLLSPVTGGVSSRMPQSKRVYHFRFLSTIFTGTSFVPFVVVVKPHCSVLSTSFTFSHTYDFIYRRNPPVKIPLPIAPAQWTHPRRFITPSKNGLLCSPFLITSPKTPIFAN